MPDAARLFVARARAVQPTFALTPENSAAVAELCRRLDGLPLAIELAAARVKVLAPEQLVAHLEQRFSLLSAGPRDAPPHQRTLRQAIAWSHDLLGEPERVLFRRLSVFRGSFTLDAVCAVCLDDPDRPHPVTAARRLDAVDSLMSVVEQSLVAEGASQGANPDATGEARFHLLETLREFGAEQLSEAGETDARMARHLSYFTALAERAEPLLRGADALAWLARLDAEQGNLQHALRFAFDRGDAEAGLRLAAALAGYWIARGQYADGLAWIEALLGLASAGAAAPAAQSASYRAARVRTLLAASDLAYLLERYADATAAAAHALALAERGADPRLAARAHLRFVPPLGLRLREYAAGTGARACCGGALRAGPGRRRAGRGAGVGGGRRARGSRSRRRLRPRRQEPRHRRRCRRPGDATDALVHARVGVLPGRRCGRRAAPGRRGAGHQPAPRPSLRRGGIARPGVWDRPPVR